MGDVLHGLGDDRGCTSKPVNGYGKMGDGPRDAAHMLTHCSIEVLIQLICLSIEVLILLICLSIGVSIQLICLSVVVLI